MPHGCKMLQIQINNEFIDLPEDASVQLNWHNSAFDTEIIQGDYSLPLTVPLTPKNRKIFRLFDIINSADREWSFPCAVFKTTIPFVTGYFDVTEITPEQATGSIRFGLAGMNVMEKKLPDIDYGDDITLPEDFNDFFAALTNIADVSWPDVPFNIPMHYNPIFYGEGLDTVNGDYGGFLNMWNAGTLEYNPPYNTTALNPWPYLMFVLQQGFLEEGYTIDGDFVNHSVLKHLMIQNNYACDKRHADDPNRFKAHLDNDQTITDDDVVMFETDFAPDGYDPANAYDVSNYWGIIAWAGTHDIEMLIKYNFDDNGGTVYTLTTSLYKEASIIAQDVTVLGTAGTGTINFHPAVFAFNSGNVGEHIQVKFEITSNVPGAFFREVQASSFLKMTNLSGQGYNFYDNVIRISNHVPDMTFGELVSALRTGYNLKIDINYAEKKVLMNFSQDLLTAAAKNWTLKAVKGHAIRNEKTAIKDINYEFQDDDKLVENNFLEFDDSSYVGAYDTFWDLPAIDTVTESAYVIAEAKFYVAKLLANVKTWVAFSDAYYDIPVSADGDVEIRAKCPPVFMTHQDVHGFDYIMPYIKQLGTSLAFGTGKQDFTLRLAIYAGLQYDKDNNGTFPFATSSYINPNGSSSYSLNLQYFYDYSLEKLFFSLWFEMLNRNEFIVKDYILHLLDLQEFDTNDPIFTDYAEYLIRNMSVTVGKKIDTASTELFMIK